jgi:hypothetical protein
MICVLLLPDNLLFKYLLHALVILTSRTSLIIAASAIHDVGVDVHTMLLTPHFKI